MSDLLDPSSVFHLLRIGITTGWRCLEIGAGNGSLSQWLAQRVGPAGHVIASDIRTDLVERISSSENTICMEMIKPAEEFISGTAARLPSVSIPMLG
jgi:tRNA A58 N-methylase Trm61